MEKNESLPKSGEQVLSSSGEEEPVPSTSAEERTCLFDKQRGMTCPFDEHQGIPVLTTSSGVVTVPSTSVVAEPVLSTSFVVQPITSTSSSWSQRVKCPVESSACSYADTAKSSLTLAAVETVSSTSTEQRSSGHQPLFLSGENSDSSDTETTESSSSGDEIPLGIYRRGRHIPIEIERVPRNFDRVELRNRVESSVFSAETALRNYVRIVHYFRELTTCLEEAVARSLAIPLAEDELHRRHSLEYHLQVYYSFVNRWGGAYSMLVDKAEVQKNMLESLKNRLDVMTEGNINFFEADDIYNVIDDLEARLSFTKLLARRILPRSRDIAVIVKKIAISIRGQ